MYNNSGYLILDFKNKSLSSPINIPCIYNKILRANKPIMITNCPSVSDGLSTYVTSSRELISGNIILTTFIAGKIQQITINSADNVSYTSTQLTTTQSVNLESEVITNASKSDSNISK